MKIVKAILSTTIVVTLLGWLYVVAYQAFYPIGITEGHPLAHCFLLNLIRIDMFGIYCFAVFGLSLFIWFLLFRK